MIFNVWTTKSADVKNPAYPAVFGQILNTYNATWTLWTEDRMLPAYYEAVRLRDQFEAAMERAEMRKMREKHARRLRAVHQARRNRR